MTKLKKLLGSLTGKELEANLTLMGEQPKGNKKKLVKALAEVYAGVEVILSEVSEEELAGAPMVAQAGFEAGMNLVISPEEPKNDSPDGEDEQDGPEASEGEQPPVEAPKPPKEEAPAPPAPLAVGSEYMDRKDPRYLVVSNVKALVDGRVFVDVRCANGLAYRLEESDLANRLVS